jgi:hypothetical protein
VKIELKYMWIRKIIKETNAMKHSYFKILLLLPLFYSTVFAKTCPVKINEILAHTDLPAVDFIELYNPTDQDILLDGWYLSDDENNPALYKIPNNSTISAKGYFAILGDNDDNPDNNNLLPENYYGSAFSLSSHGEKLTLSTPDLNNCHTVTFQDSANNESFGRHINSAGKELFPAQKKSTIKAENTGPRIPDIVISEICYRPALEDAEFIEITNISENTVKFYDPLFPENRWKISGINFTFPENSKIGVDETILVISSKVDIQKFRPLHSIPSHITIYQFTGRLDKYGETISLKYPDKPDEKYIPYIVMDEVSYSFNSPWTADKNAPFTIEKTPIDNFANDPAAWRLSSDALGTPGKIGDNPFADAPDEEVIPENEQSPDEDSSSPGKTGSFPGSTDNSNGCSCILIY